MESIEKLRYYIDHGIIHRDSIIELIDAIEREIAEKYMLLPVDAECEPIHIGDAMDDGKVAKLVISDDGEHSVYVYKLPNVLHEFYCYETAHVKPRTVEDVLNELLDDYMNDVRRGDEDIIAKYAAELQMRGDAE